MYFENICRLYCFIKISVCSLINKSNLEPKIIILELEVYFLIQFFYWLEAYYIKMQNDSLPFLNAVKNSE